MGDEDDEDEEPITPERTRELREQAAARQAARSQPRKPKAKKVRPFWTEDEDQDVEMIASVLGELEEEEADDFTQRNKALSWAVEDSLRKR